MRSSIPRWVVPAIPMALLILIAACSGGGHGGDDDDNAPSYGSDIAGSYAPVQMTYDADTCSPGNVEQDPVIGIIEITQSKDFSQGTVSYTATNPPGDPKVLFEGTVYGDTVLNLGVETNNAGASCTKISAENYQVRVDPDLHTVTGHISKDISYQGSGCDSSNINCYFEQSFAPPPT